MPEGIAVVIFAILVLATLYFDDKLSYSDYPTDFRQAWYTLFLGVAIKWGVDLMISQDWGDLMMVVFLFLLLVGGLVATIRNRRNQDKREQDYRIRIMSSQMNDAIEKAVKEGIKEGVKEAINEINKQHKFNDNNQ